MKIVIPWNKSSISVDASQPMSRNGVVDTGSSSNSGPMNSDNAGGSSLPDMSAMLRRAVPKPEENLDDSVDNAGI